MKKSIFIEPTERSPYIKFDSQTGIMEIKGRSIMENAKLFYEPVIGEWFDQYVNNPAENTVMNINLEYFNTSSSIWIFQLMRKLEVILKKSKQVSINWHYSDDDILEAGEDYEPLTSVPFNFIEIPEE